MIPAVNHDGCAGLSHDRDELVHDAAGHPGELVLRLLAGERLFLRGRAMRAGQRLQERVHGHLEGRRAGEAAA